MTKIDWKRKLSSRKFWMALIGFVSALLLTLNFAQADVEKITGIIMSSATLIAYILSEGFIDAKNAEGNSKK
ncbi:hypothetical protein FL857_05850 [Criibacterium bergeronii]|uniref:Holin n=1 Tax=Criibacterium bergeronii TaxID=1871336 RepID=A0A552V6Y0_9FIRM|nr:hypothetical protein [Criibacterium bergeronii]TRW26208.1 hypothetical protein FL857_05850 [Criibacterium bergeronii]